MLPPHDRQIPLKTSTPDRCGGASRRAGRCRQAARPARQGAAQSGAKVCQGGEESRKKGAQAGRGCKGEVAGGAAAPGTNKAPKGSPEIAHRQSASDEGPHTTQAICSAYARNIRRGGRKIGHRAPGRRGANAGACAIASRAACSGWWRDRRSIERDRQHDDRDQYQ